MTCYVCGSFMQQFGEKFMNMFRYFLFIMSFYVGALSSVTPQEIDDFVEKTMNEWNVPGLSLAIIHKGEEVRLKGYGVRERGQDKPVDGKTLFQINSLTKAFTSLTASMLVREGKIDWDTPIRTYLPDFRSINPIVTECLTIRDLLCHRSGLPGNLHQGWRLFVNTKRSMKELLDRLAFVELAYPFRSRFNYDNIGYAVVGEVVARTSGMPWADVCRERIFQPLNMERTSISFSLLAMDENAALPHLDEKDDPVSRTNWEENSMEAAAGINSCAHDMALWLRYCLTNHPDFVETQKPLTAMYPENMCLKTEYEKFNITSHNLPLMHYGMGWWTYKLENKDVFRHTGGSSGMQSVLAIVPEEDLGIVILMNQGWFPVASCLMNHLLDLFLDSPSVDWLKIGREVYSKVKENQLKWLEDCQAMRNSEILPSLPLSKYVGCYTHPGYGSIAIGKGEEGLEVSLLFSEEKGHLEHWEGNQFEIKDIPTIILKPFLCEFMISEEGDATALKIQDMGLFERDLK